jgi:hypothetical protein
MTCKSYKYLIYMDFKMKWGNPQGQELVLKPGASRDYSTGDVE